MRRAALAAGAVVALGGCGGGGGAGGPVRVSAATSLKPAFEACAPKARLSFGGSDELAAQIRQGARPDVFAAANTELPRQLAAAGRLEEPEAFASNRLVAAVPRGSRIDSLGQLAGRGVKVAVGRPEVPVGAYTRRVLAEVPEGRRILANVRTEEPDVGGVVAKVARRAADAGFVYATDVRAAKGALRAIALPRRLATAQYGIGLVKGAPHGAAGRRFLSSVRSGACAAALRRAGFGAP